MRYYGYGQPGDGLYRARIESRAAEWPGSLRGWYLAAELSRSPKVPPLIQAAVRWGDRPRTVVPPLGFAKPIA